MKRSREVTIVSLEVIAEFHSWLFDHGKSQHTAKAYSTDLRMFLAATGTATVLPDEFEDLGAAWLTRDRRKVAQKTTSRRLTSLRAFARWAGWGDVLGDYDAPVAARAVPHPLPEGVDGVRRLVAATDVQQRKCLIALCGLVGCRVGEALSIVPTSFETSTMTLVIRGKGDKERRVPVSTEAWEILEKSVIRAFVAGTTVVNMQDRNARKVITTLGLRAGLRRHISSHDLRATFGTEVYNKTGDIRLVQELLGHANVTQTEVYIGVSDGALRKAVEL